MNNFSDFIKAYWSIVFTVVSCVITLTAGYYSYGFRISAIEARQDRQGDAIVKLQTDVTDFKTSLARLEANVDNLSSNVDYIRNKLDRVFP